MRPVCCYSRAAVAASLWRKPRSPRGGSTVETRIHPFGRIIHQVPPHRRSSGNRGCFHYFPDKYSAINSRERGGHGRHRRHQRAKSDGGLSADRGTNDSGLRDSHQQGCGATHFHCSVTPKTGPGGAVRLTVLVHAKDSLWSVDLFRCESAILRAHWVLVVMDQCTRRIVGFGVHRGVVDGVGLCRMFNRATRGHTPPTYLSSDHDRLYQSHYGRTNAPQVSWRYKRCLRAAPCWRPLTHSG